MSWQSFEEVKEQALVCRRCRLHETRTQVVWMDGNRSSDLMFIGEAPGFHEDRIGKPFVGAAGKLLDEVLLEIGLDRTKCTICNVIKCRPPDNRNPLPDEIELCNPYLQAQVRFIDPRVIVTLGNFATRFMLQRQVSISKVRGQKFQIGRASVIPTFHPAAVLHGGGANSPVMASLRSDFALISQTLAELRADAARNGPSNLNLRWSRTRSLTSEQLVVETRSADETVRLGAALSPVLLPGDMIVLAGDLGAGKTTFTQGLAAGLGVTEQVTSPTFVLMKEYLGGKYPLMHLDIYRLGRVQELIDLGYDEFLDPSYIVVVEWGDMVEPLLPVDHLQVDIGHVDEDRRTVTLRPSGLNWKSRMETVTMLADQLFSAGRHADPGYFGEFDAEGHRGPERRN